MNHDSYGDDAADRIQPSEWRSPRCVLITAWASGEEFWSELTVDDEALDTTLTGRVLDPIQRELRSGKNGGSVIVDGIEYVFVVTRSATSSARPSSAHISAPS